MIPNSFIIHTFGCRLNKSESINLHKELFNLGLTPNDKNPDFIFINSCCLTSKTQSQIKRFIRKTEKNNPNSKIIVLGCWVDNLVLNKINLKKIKNELKIDYLIPNKDKENISQYISTDTINRLSCRGNKSAFPASKSLEENSGRLFTKIQTGCNKFCSYCLIPYLRGQSQSIPISQILTQIKKAEKNGILEIILTGIDISQYHDKKNNLTALIKQILQKTKIPRLRLGSIYPEAFTSNFLSIYKNNQNRLCRHFHISLQSACNSTLSRMNRKYTIEKYQKVIQKIKKAVPETSITTDIIVGFPGETNKEFKQTLKNLEELPISKIHVFPFSPRPNTLAYKKQKEWSIIPLVTKKSRAAKIRNLSAKKYNNYKSQFIGKTLPVLFEAKDKNNNLIGWSDNYIRVKSKQFKQTPPFIKSLLFT